MSISFDYEPFYVGASGDPGRMFKHLIRAKKSKISDSNNYKISTIKKILRHNQEPIIFKFFDNMNDLKTAFKLEKLLVKIIGRSDKKLGPLTNLTDGGEGVEGHIPTIESRLKISKSLIGNIPWNKDKKGSQTAWCKGLTKETHTGLKKISDSRKGMIFTVEHKKNISKGKLKGKVINSKELINKYFELEGNSNKLAKYFDISSPTIIKYLKEHGIPIFRGSLGNKKKLLWIEQNKDNKESFYKEVDMIK